MTKPIAVIALLVGAGSASARDPVDPDMKLFRKDFRSIRKQFIAANMDINDKQAEKYIHGRVSVDQAIQDVRLKYFPFIRKVISGAATVRFFQVDWRLGLPMDPQLAAQTPVIEP
jgi:hypothetical protein